MKVLSFNTLFCGYSKGFTSFRDQLLAVRRSIEQERPDVACFLEMPNPFDEVTGDSLALHDALAQLDHWLIGEGYPFFRKLNNKLSVWIVSKTPMVPLLVVGSACVSGAISKLVDHPRSEVDLQITTNSTFADCLRHMSVKANRSLVVGVCHPKNPQTILPLIAVHAPCEYENHRYGKLLLHLLSSMVSQVGVVVGDFNFDISQRCSLHEEETATLLRQELPSAIATSLLQLPVGRTFASQTPTAMSVTFPYQPLCIDGFICNSKAPISVSSGRVNVKEASATIPHDTHASDHYWISAEIPDDVMITCKQHCPAVDARLISFQWSCRYPELMRFMERKGQLPLEPSAFEALKTPKGVRPASRPPTPNNNEEEAPPTYHRGAPLTEAPVGSWTGVITSINQSKYCGGIHPEGYKTSLVFFFAAKSEFVSLDARTIKSGKVQVKFNVIPGRHEGELLATDVSLI